MYDEPVAQQREMFDIQHHEPFGFHFRADARLDVMFILFSCAVVDDSDMNLETPVDRYSGHLTA